MRKRNGCCPGAQLIADRHHHHHQQMNRLYIMLATVLMSLLATASAQLSNSKKYCSGFEPQRSLDLDQVLGLWYAVEVVHHWEGSNSQQLHGRSVVDTCPIIHLDRSEESRLRLLWTEDAGIIEYSFSVDYLRSPSLWISIGAQNGIAGNEHADKAATEATVDEQRALTSFVDIANGSYDEKGINRTKNGTLLNRKYRQFAGTVEVTKAVGDHMVLTFCTPGREIYSVVLARERWLSGVELEGVNNMLAHRGLQSLAIREACKSSAINIYPGIIQVLLLAVYLRICWF